MKPFVLQLLLLIVLRPECAWALSVAIRTSYPSKNIQERFSLNSGEGTFLCHGLLSFIQKKQALVFGFLDGSVVKNLPANAGDTGSIPWWGRSPGEGNDNPLQCPCLENPMDRGAWWLQSMGFKEPNTTEQLSTYTIWSLTHYNFSITFYQGSFQFSLFPIRKQEAMLSKYNSFKVSFFKFSI